MITEFTNPHNMYCLDRAMNVAEVEHGIILPKTQDMEYPMWGLGGVCDQQDQFVELSFYDGGWATHGGRYDWCEEEYCGETAVYFGVFFKHWGHFLVDLVGRMWYFAQRKELPADLKIAYLGEEELTGNYLEFLSLLGIRPEQLLRITKPTRFKKVIVPEFSCRSCVWYSREYQEMFDAMVRRVEEEGYTLDVPQKVYFSRLAFGKAKASEFGECHIARWLEVNGYTAVGPETLSVRDQICIWNRAEEIACLDGTIPLNSAFCRNTNLELLVMHKTHLEHQNLELFLLMRPCRVTLLDAYWEPFKKYPTSIGAGPFLLCVGEDIQRYSELNGMDMPFTKAQLCRQRMADWCKLVWCILNIKGRIRRVVSKLLPKGVKARARSLLRR